MSAAGLVAGGLLIGLLASETAYRVARQFICVPLEPSFYQRRSWGWTHVPNASTEQHRCIGRRFAWRTTLTFNSHGLRDREYSYEKPSGTRRVLLLGDSVTEAIQVPAEQTFAKLAEARLKNDATPVEVINAGHAGFGTDNELLFYREEGQRYQADLVVLVFNYQNDIVENDPELSRRHYGSAVTPLPKPSFRFGPDDELQLVPAPPAPSGDTWETWLFAKFYVLRAAARLVAPPVAGSAIVTPLNFEVYAPWDDEWTSAWRMTMRLIEVLRNEVKANGARFAIALMPDRVMTEPASFPGTLSAYGLTPERYDLERPRRAMDAFLATTDIPVVDLLPSLQTPSVDGGDFVERDVHLNAAGHAAVAPALASFVRRRLDDAHGE